MCVSSESTKPKTKKRFYISYKSHNIRAINLRYLPRFPSLIVRTIWSMRRERNSTSSSTHRSFSARRIWTWGYSWWIRRSVTNQTREHILMWCSGTELETRRWDSASLQPPELLCSSSGSGSASSSGSGSSSSAGSDSGRGFTQWRATASCTDELDLPTTTTARLQLVGSR